MARRGKEESCVVSIGWNTAHDSQVKARAYEITVTPYINAPGTP